MSASSIARAAFVNTTDEWLRGLFTAADAPPGVALVAVGGLGRHELSPFSDLDLLLLHDPGVQDVSQIADRIWYPIWDAGRLLDHSVRTVAQARKVAVDDLKAALGLLDARVIAGDAQLGAQLRETTYSDWRAFAAQRLPQLRELVAERRGRVGELAHLTEPELKESYGGLRDITILRAIAASWVTDVDHSIINAASERLLDVRDALHHVTSRASDRLVQQEQHAVAELLGFRDRDELSRSVSDAGRRIEYASDLAWHRVGRNAPKTSRFSPRRFRRAGAERVPLADGVVAQNGEVVLALAARPEHDPVLVLRAAAAAAQAGVMLSPATLERLAMTSAAMPVPWPRDAREAFVSLLGAGEHAVIVWEALDQAGIIDRLIPGWDVVRSAPQRDPIHRYTVDRHLVSTAAAAAASVRDVHRPDLLLVGALLHDFGKGRGGDHTERGMELVAELGPRLGFNDNDVETLVAMVELHLLLPDVATKRDLDDPSVIEAVAARVGSRDHLELLAALARADAIATGPATQSEWRAQLIDTLVRRVFVVLAGEPLAVEPKLSDAQRALAHSQGVQVLVEHQEPIFTITVAVPDEKGILAAQAGVLAMHRLEVRAAHTESISNRAVSVWTTQPMFGDPPSLERIREDITRVLAGTLDLRLRLALPADHAQRVTPVVTIEGSVLEVRAHDAPGLLYRLGTAICEADAVITAAKVSTLGSEVVDVFTLVNSVGEPLSDAHAAAVRATVTRALA